MAHFRGYAVIAALVWAALGGTPTRAQNVVYNDSVGAASLTVDGNKVKPAKDGSFTFQQTYTNNFWSTAPPNKVAQVVFIDPASQGGGVSDIFQYTTTPNNVKHTTTVTILFVSDGGEGKLFTPLKAANSVPEPSGAVSLGTFNSTTNYEFKDASGNALSLPNGLTVTAVSTEPEPSSTASLGLFAGLLAVVGAIRIRKRRL